MPDSYEPDRVSATTMRAKACHVQVLSLFLALSGTAGLTHRYSGFEPRCPEEKLVELSRRLDVLEADQQTLAEQLKLAKEENSVLKRRLMVIYWPSSTFTRAKRRVAFHARLATNTSVVPWKPLVLSDVVTNEGQAYNGTSGQFTPPVAGTYLLLVTIATPGVPGTIAEVEVMVNQTRVAYATSRDEQYPDTAAGHVVVTLETGAPVWLRSPGFCAYAGGMQTTFSGVLL